MTLRKKEYKNRLVDKKIARYLNIFGAISIKGPKWCGKTWTSLNHANSVTYMTEKNLRDLANVNPKYIFTGESPQLIDEWQLSPSIWDAVRHECDEDHNKGKFILTGSTTLTKEEKEEHIFHSGTGRIANIQMFPMSLYESEDSTGDVSILDMLEGNVKLKGLPKTELFKIARLIIRGGWPQNLTVDEKDVGIIPKSYIDSLINIDINERRDKKRDSNKMKMLLRSLARNETSLANVSTIIKDIEEYETSEDLIASRTTVYDYLSVLESLFLINNQPAFDINYRSSKRVGKSVKRHFVDPSLACAILNLNEEKLMNDFETFGLMFEALVERDLKIYMDYLEGNLFHFRDNNSGDEVDAILEFRDGAYGAVKIKLTENGISDAKQSLSKFYTNVEKKPVFMCIITGTHRAIEKDEKTGIYILPITALKP